MGDLMYCQMLEGELTRPIKLPPFIYRGDRQVKTSELTEAELIQLGFFVYGEPEHDQETEYLGRPYLNGNIATCEVFAKDQTTILSRLAAYRYEVETGGYIYNSWPVHSDDRAQFKALAEITRIQAGVRTDGDLWKFKDGVFRSLTNNEFLAMYNAGASFVQKCFECERQCRARVEAGESNITKIWLEEWIKL